MRLAPLFGALALIALTQPAAADSRYSCMAGDGKIKLAVRLEISEELGGRLAHFSGAMSVLTPDAPPELAKLKLDSHMLTQHWVDRQSVLMRLYDHDNETHPLFISIGARMDDQGAARLHGTYQLNRPNGKEPGLRLEGALYCQIDRMADVALADPL